MLIVGLCITRRIRNPNQKFYCSKDHLYAHRKENDLYNWTQDRKDNLSKLMSGSNNPNYGKKWTEDQKNIQSTLVKSKVNDTYRSLCAKAMKGKTGILFSQEHRLKISESNFGVKNHFYGKTHSKESKLKIGAKSKEHFANDESLAKSRITRELKGLWIPNKLKDSYDLYNKLANWQFGFITKNDQECKLLKENGIFNSWTNINGIVRDHIYSRKDGFNNLVFPEILRHPINCKLILHKDNASKRSSSNISLDELFDLILNYDLKYNEQQLCILKIQEYKQGNRYMRENYE